jgi:protocatechuate 3,4-dioxygenase beta subunit
MKALPLSLIVLLFGGPLAARQVGAAVAEKAALEGQVVKAATGEPLKKALLRLRKADARAQVATAVTDAGGRFAFSEIEPGRYRLSVQRNGYLQQRYGQRAPNHPGTILSLAPGQRLRDIVFRLIPYGVITGQVYDEDGEWILGASVQVLLGASVQVLRYMYVGGERQLIPSGRDQTNDLGEYRVYGLAPGRYYVSASAETSLRPSAGRAQASPEEGYAPTFYPGTNDPNHASPIELRGGDVLSSIDFGLLPTPTVRVRGQVVNSVGSRPGTDTKVFLLPHGLAFRGSGFRRGAEVNGPSGSFEIRGVTPGSYNLVAVSFDQDKEYFTRLPLEVRYTDVEGIRLVIRSGVELAGRISVEGHRSAGGQEQDELDMTTLHVFLQPFENLPRFGGADPGKANADGSFKLENVPREKYRVNVLGLPRDYYLKAARVRGTTVLEEGLDLSGGQPWGKLELVVSSAGSRIDGAVLTEEQQAFSGASVVLIPEGRRRRDPHFYKTVTTDQNGHFALRGIPPGDYKLFAWEEVEPGAYQDANFLRLHEKRGKAVRLQEADRLSERLEVIPAGEVLR